MLEQKLENLAKTGYKDMTVADLVARLAGLPPMMEIFINADGVSMYLNDTMIEENGDFPPFLRIVCSKYSSSIETYKLTYEERLARQAQRSRELSS